MSTFAALLLEFCLVIIPYTEAAACENTWTPYGDDKFCVKYFDDLKFRNDAATSCVGLGARLVSIQDAFNNQQIQQLKGDVKAHIGLEYNLSTHKFSWADNSNFYYTNFASVTDFENKVNNYGNCVGMNRNGKWTNVNCDEEPLGYICMKDAQNNADSNTCPDPDLAYMDRGTISSPMYPGLYGAGLSCTYGLAAKSGHTVSITIDEHALGENDQLMFYNGYSTQATNLLACFKGNSVCDTTKPAQTTFKSTTNFVRVIFTTQGTGKWKFTWNGVPDDADTSVSTDQCPSPTYVYRENGKLCSPGYPKKYGTNNDCTYLLSAKSGRIVQINFPKLTLANGDYIAIYENSLTAAAAPFATSSNGIREREPISTPYSDVKVVFHSGAVGGGEWTLLWNSTIQCPASTYSSAGEIYSPGYPSSYDPLMRCVYSIQTYYGARITINFREISMDSISDMIKIYDGWREDETPVVISGYKQSFQYNSTGNQVMLVFTSGSLQQPWHHWSASFNSFYRNL